MPEFKRDEMSPDDLGGHEAGQSVEVNVTEAVGAWRWLKRWWRHDPLVPVDLSPGVKDYVQQEAERQEKIDRSVDEAMAKACDESDQTKKVRGKS